MCTCLVPYHFSFRFTCFVRRCERGSVKIRLLLKTVPPFCFISLMIRYNSVGIVAEIRIELPRKRGIDFCQGKEGFSASHRRQRLGSSPRLLSNTTDIFPGSRAEFSCTSVAKCVPLCQVTSEVSVERGKRFQKLRCPGVA